MTVAPTIPNTVTDMECAFEHSGLVTAPAIPASVTTICECFAYCENLTTAPDLTGATGLKIMDSCFEGSSSLQTVPLIPASVESCSYYAFAYCSALSGSVTIMAQNITNEMFELESIFTGTTNPITIYVPAGSVTATKFASAASSYWANVTVIPQ